MSELTDVDRDVIGWDEDGNLYLPDRFAHIGVAMDRRDAADEIQRAFDGARRRTATDTDPIRHAEAMRLGEEAWARFRAARDGGAR